MSTILKALRRLEEEKASADSGRDLREQVAARTPMPPARPGWRAPAAVAAVLLSALAGAGTIWWIFGGDAAREAAEPAPRIAEAPPAPAAPAPAPATTFAPDPAAGPPEDAFASDVETVPRPHPQPRLADAEPLEPRRPPAAGTRRPVLDTQAAARAREAALREAEMRAGLAELEGTAEAAPAPVVVPEPVPAIAAPAPEAEAPAPPPKAATPAPRPAPEAAPAPKPAPPPEPAREVAAAKPAPKVSTPAAPALPDVLVQKTQWHPLSDRRTAWLQVACEAREVVEGDVVEGMLVEEIQPSGVVFERDGEPLRRGVGER